MRYYSKRYKRRHTPQLLVRKRDHAMLGKAATGAGMYLKNLFSSALASIGELRARIDRGEFPHPEPVQPNEHGMYAFPLFTVPEDPNWTEPDDYDLEESEECAIIVNDINVPKPSN